MHDRNIAKDKNLIPLTRLLIEQGVALNGISKHGESAIGQASRMGRFDVVKLLLDAGADGDFLSWTPIMHAIAFGSLDAVKQCLKDEMDTHLWWDAASRTPWLLAIQIGDIAKAKLLYEKRQDDEKSLFFAVINDQSAMLQWLLDKGFDLNAISSLNETPLMAACENGATECVKVLLAAGVDVHATGQYDDSAINTE